MGIFEHFPYTNFHELNLDWLLRKMKELENTVAEAIHNQNSIWRPSVSAGGVLSWTRSESETAPDPVNIKGAQGEQGPAGPQGPQGPAGQDGAAGAAGEQGPAGPAGPQGPEGPQGPQGVQGEQGIQGVGVPTGGTAGQVLAKASGADYDTEWVNAGGGSGSYLPLAGGNMVPDSQNTSTTKQRFATQNRSDDTSQATTYLDMTATRVLMNRVPSIDSGLSGSLDSVDVQPSSVVINEKTVRNGAYDETTTTSMQPGFVSIATNKVNPSTGAVSARSQITAKAPTGASSPYTLLELETSQFDGTYTLVREKLDFMAHPSTNVYGNGVHYTKYNASGTILSALTVNGNGISDTVYHTPTSDGQYVQKKYVDDLIAQLKSDNNLN